MGFFTQIKEKLVGKSTKQNEKYVVFKQICAYFDEILV